MRNLFFLSLIVFFLNTAQSQSPKPTPWCFVGNSSGVGEPQGLQQIPNGITLPTQLIHSNVVIIIPVVFHVVYNVNSPEQNISDDRINETLNRLNADFSLTNSDHVNVPAVWQNLKANVGFRLVKACVGPDGNPVQTPGIRRVPTTHGVFNVNYSNGEEGYFEPMLTSEGGTNAWPTNTYLNVWICDISNDGGYARFPWLRNTPIIVNGTSHSGDLFDGIVLDYLTVGDPSPSPFFNMGRVITHELGHWLGLYHIWQPPCSSGDYVNDTPPQENGTINCATPPNYPERTDNCTPNSPGIMYMNQMDTPPCDDGKIFFTTGQRTRTRSFFTPNPPGPVSTRFPFIQNYFGFEDCPAGSITPVNQIIRVRMKNPACMSVLYDVDGPVTIVQQGPSELVLQVACGSSGSVSIIAMTSCYITRCEFTFVDPGCDTWPKLFEGKAFINLMKDNSVNLFAWLGNVYNFSTNVNHIGPFPAPSFSGKYTIQYNKHTGVTTWVKPDITPCFVLNSGIVQIADINSFPVSYPFLNGPTGNPVSPPPPLTTNQRVIAESASGEFIRATINGINDQIHSNGSNIILNGAIWRTFFNPNTNNVFVFTINGSTVSLSIYKLVGNILQLQPGQSSFSSTAQPLAVDNAERVYVVLNNLVQEYVYNNPSPYFTPVFLPGFNNSFILPLNSFVPHVRVEDKYIVINWAERNLYYLDFGSLQSKRISFTFDPWSEVVFQDALLDGNDIYISGSIYTPGYIGIKAIQFIGITSNETIFLAKFAIGDFSFNKAQLIKPHIIAQPNGFNISIFPNPAKETIRINASKRGGEKDKGLFRLLMFDHITNNVFQKEGYMSGQELDISNLRPGIYFIQMLNSKGEVAWSIFSKL